MSSLSEGDLNLIRRYFPLVRQPAFGDKVFKEECVLSFDNTESPTGIFVSLHTFMAYGEHFVEQDFQRTGNGLYLNIKTTKTLKPQVENDENKPLPTKLAIGVEGGFKLDSEQYDYNTVYSLYVLPEKKSFPFPSEDLPHLVQQSCQGIINIIDADKQEVIEHSWEQSKVVSKYAENLVQLDNGKKISSNPADWKCEDSGMSSNLWLNLSTGYIGSGRRNDDGTGGTGAALRHYEETGKLYPLVVKLRTITPFGADVYSYAADEDDMVIDPKLKEHLAHWGLDMETMNKTEKSMDELNIEYNITFEYSKIVEEDVEPISGAGYIGLKNLGNSCYINSLYQVLFSLPLVSQRYLRPELLQNPPESPPTDLITQMAKLAAGLLSDRYVSEGSVAPKMMKHLMGRNHEEFSSNRQQDALEYYQHVLTRLSRADKNENPAKYFTFKLESKLQCMSSQQVKYSTFEENCLTLPIFVEDAINKEEVQKYEELVKSKPEDEKCEPVLPVVPFEKLIERFSANECIDDFLSPATKEKGIAIKTTRFASMPNYLLISLAKYVPIGGVIKKLEVEVPIPEVLNIEHLRSAGIQPGEVQMDVDDEVKKPSYDPNIVQMLTDMGFTENGAKRACLAVKNVSADAASIWIMEHMEDIDLNDPLPEEKSNKSSGGSSVDPEKVANLVSFGIDEKHARAGLLATGGDFERAADWCFSHEPVDEMEAENSNEVVDNSNLDGPGDYELVGIISHIGRNTSSGHYVAHVKKNGQWIFFNDEKVFVSKNPPLNHGYLYLYQRKA